MRAVVCEEYGPVESLSLKNLPDPTPDSGEVVIDVKAAGINFPDLLIVQGKYQVRPPLPFVPGGECAGVVSAVGEKVQGIVVGDRVIGTGQVGAFAEKMKLPAKAVMPIPPGLDFAAASGVTITYGTSYYALKQRAALQAGETLLVLGASGGVGLAAVELGKHMGATVIAAASSDEKLAVAAEAGADLTLNYTTDSIKDKVKELTQGAGADVVYDPVGGDYSEAAFRATAWRGRHLVVGFAAGEIPKIPLNLALLKGASLVGVFWGSWCGREPQASAENMRELGELFAAGRLKPQVKTFPLEEYATALATLAERRATGKVVLTMEV